jgi:hypothetical protein
MFGDTIATDAPLRKTLNAVRRSRRLTLWARIQLQQVITIVRDRKRVYCAGPLEGLSFESIFPLAGFRRASSRAILESLACARIRCIGGLSIA